jgi:hypothetical protein
MAVTPAAVTYGNVSPEHHHHHHHQQQQQQQQHV